MFFIYLTFISSTKLSNKNSFVERQRSNQIVSCDVKNIN